METPETLLLAGIQPVRETLRPARHPRRRGPIHPATLSRFARTFAFYDRGSPTTRCGDVETPSTLHVLRRGGDLLDDSGGDDLRK
jgi:hypothetical protein